MATQLTVVSDGLLQELVGGVVALGKTGQRAHVRVRPQTKNQTTASQAATRSATQRTEGMSPKSLMLKRPQPMGCQSIGGSAQRWSMQRQRLAPLQARSLPHLHLGWGGGGMSGACCDPPTRKTGQTTGPPLLNLHALVLNLGGDGKEDRGNG